MSRFAKIEEEAIKRQSELSGEELRLYLLIKFHTWNDSGVCNKNLRELATIYHLDYDNTTRRYKSLRKYGWCENTKNGIRPTVKFTVEYSEETVKITVEKDSKTVKNAVSDCKNYSERDSKTVKNAVSFNKEYIEPFKDENFLTATTTEPTTKKTGVVVADSNHLSQFSIEECLAYVELCEREGQSVRNRYGLAMHLFETGESDALILAKLQPETNLTANPPTEAKRNEALALLLDVRSAGEDVNEFKHWYATEDWAWLMRELNNVEKSG